MSSHNELAFVELTTSSATFEDSNPSVTPKVEGICPCEGDLSPSVRPLVVPIRSSFKLLPAGAEISLVGMVGSVTSPVVTPLSPPSAPASTSDASSVPTFAFVTSTVFVAAFSLVRGAIGSVSSWSTGFAVELGGFSILF